MSDELRRVLVEKMKGLIPEVIVLATVIEVNEAELSCTCKTVNEGIEIYNVSLAPVIEENTAEVIRIPEIDSHALVAIIQNDIRNSYLVSCQKCEKIIIRGGELGGLVKVNNLRDELNKTTELLQALISIISGSPIPEPGNSAPSALQTALSSAIAGKSLGKWDDIENERVVHG